MDIDGEEDYEDIDIDLDALDLAYPDEETPSLVLPLQSAVTNVDSTTYADKESKSGTVPSCNSDILMAFEDAGGELEDGDDESEEDLLMSLAYPDGGSPSASLCTTTPVR